MVNKKGGALRLRLKLFVLICAFYKILRKNGLHKCTIQVNNSNEIFLFLPVVLTRKRNRVSKRVSKRVRERVSVRVRVSKRVSVSTRKRIIIIFMCVI